MENLASPWQKFFKNLGWYIATIVVLSFSLRFLSWYGMFLLWAVGLIWGGVLAYQFSQLLFGRDEVFIEERLRGYINQAVSYKTQIDEAIKAHSGKTERIHQDRLMTQIETWTESITTLAERLNLLRQDTIIRRDLQQVPKAIADLEVRLARETDSSLQAQLKRTLNNRQKQLEALEQLQHTMERAEIQIESTLSMLGTIYSQILTGQSTSHVANYDRLSADVDEEVRLLQDQLEALREVKLGGV